MKHHLRWPIHGNLDVTVLMTVVGRGLRQTFDKSSMLRCQWKRKGVSQTPAQSGHQDTDEDGGKDDMLLEIQLDVQLLLEVQLLRLRRARGRLVCQKRPGRGCRTCRPASRTSHIPCGGLLIPPSQWKKVWLNRTRNMSMSCVVVHVNDIGST